MIETTILNYLKSKLTVPVYMEKPTNLDEFVLIEKTGSSQSDHIKRATFAIQSWSNSLYNAAKLNDDVMLALLGDGTSGYGIVENSAINRCDLNSDYNFSDTTTKSYRYQAVYDFVY